MDLAQATTLTPLGEGRFGVELPEEFSIGGGKPNGGFMLACLGHAAVVAAADAGSEHPHPISTGASYQWSPDLGPAEIETEVLRVGRTASQVTARLVQGDKVAVAARFTLGALREGSTPFWGSIPPPEMAPIDECISMTRADRPANGTQLLFDPDHALTFGPDGPTGTGEGELRAWFRLDDDRAVTPVELLFVSDAMPPATFTVVQTGWVPTLDLTTYVRAVPVPGPLRIRFRTTVIQDGFADEVCEVWDSEDRLVVQATQICALRLPEG